MRVSEILRHSSKLSAASLPGYLLAPIVNIYMYRRIGPEGAGILAVISVWTLYSGLVRPGLWNAAAREMPYFLGSGDERRARELQNVGLTGELAFSIVPVLILVTAGAFQSNPVLRTAFWIGAVACWLSSAQGFFTGAFYIYQRIGVVARVRLATQVGSPLVLLALLPWMGVYSPLIATAAAGVAALVIVFRNRDVFRFRPAWNWPEARSLLRAGFPLSLLTITGWAYLASDRATLIAAGVSLTALGFYAFAGSLVRMISQVFDDFAAVLQPILWTEMGRHGSVGGLSEAVTRVWLAYCIAGAVAASLAQAGFGLLVAIAVPNFLPSVPLFEVLVFMLLINNSVALPNLVLGAKTVNRQNTLLVLWGTGLAVNVAAVALVARSGAGLRSVAAASMAVDALLVGVGLALAHKHLFATVRAGWDLYGWMMLFLLTDVALYFLFQWGSFAYRPKSILVPAALRLTAALVVWLPVGGSLYIWLRTRQARLQDGEAPDDSPHVAPGDSLAVR